MGIVMEDVQLPSLDTFLSKSWPTNAYIEYPGFDRLYVRKGGIYVRIGVETWYCAQVLTIANVEATTPGQGAFARLVEDLCVKGYAVYVENVHNKSFAVHLRKLGYTLVNEQFGAANFLYAYDGHLRKFREF